MSYHVEIYTTEDGKQPFMDYLRKLGDKQGRNKIRVKLERIKEGNLGPWKKLHHGVAEVKIYYGPGYRIYFAFIAPNKILILWVGTKKTQQRDIERATKYWNNHKKRMGASCIRLVRITTNVFLKILKI